MTRRSLFRWIGIGAAGAVVAGGVAATARGAVNGVWSSGQGTPYEAWTQWRDEPGMLGIVAAGIVAANPHNTQPWSFVIDDDTIEVWSDPSRRMVLGDATAREHIGGLGCAVENMVIAASALGFEGSVTRFPDGIAAPDASEPLFVARIDLTAGVARSSELFDAIGRRRTDRGAFASRALPASVLEELGAAASAVDDAAVLWLTEPADRQRMGALLVDATAAIVADTEQSVEAFSWFRNDRADIDRHRDGLTLDGQGLDAFTLAAAKILPAQSRTAGDAFWLDRTKKVHTATAAAYGVITVADVHDRELQFAGGRLLERLHLAATAKGLGFHHMNPISERIDRDAALGHEDAFSARYADVLGVPASTALFAFRIGYSESTPLSSPRRVLDDVLDG